MGREPRGARFRLRERAAKRERKGGPGCSDPERAAQEPAVSPSPSALRPSLSPDATIDDDIDLLAGLIGRSLRPPAARNAAASLIDAFGGLAGVAAADEAALRRGGLAKAAVADLGRVRALGIAMAREEACQRPVLSSWSALVAYLRAALAHAPREQFRTLYLDKRNILIRAEWRADDPTVQAAVERRIERLLDATAARIVSGRRDGGPVEVRGEPSSFAAAN